MMLPIHFITVHCAATREGRAYNAQQIAEMGIRRFGQPSYHYVVELDGKVTATLPSDRRGAHVAGANTGNIGVCYVGGLTADGRSPKDTRTPAQRDALRDLVATLRRRYPGARVLGHRDWPGVAKACPSFDVATRL